MSIPAPLNSETYGLGIYYHIFNKGAENKFIFKDEEDYATFTNYLKEYLSRPLNSDEIKKNFIVNGRTFQGVPHQPKNFFNKIDLVAYSLGANEFHLILKPLDRSNLESFIRSLSTRYSMYFNKKYQNKGALFLSSSKVIPINNNKDLTSLLSEIHSNKEKYSSYMEYSGKNETPWIKSDDIRKYVAENSSTKPKPEQNENKTYITSEYSNYSGFKLIAYISFLIFLLTTSNILKSNLKEILIVSSLSTPIGLYFIMEFAKPKKSYSEAKPRKLVMISTTLMFIILFNIGLTRVKSAEKNHVSLLSNQEESPKVMAASTEKNVENIPSNTPTPTGILAVSIVTQKTAVTTTPEPTASATSEGQLKKMLKVKITDNSQYANIYKSTSTYSDKITEAKDGQKFEYNIESYGWYQIKLPGELTGYISEKYIELLDNQNN